MGQESSSSITFSGVSHIGPVRGDNQDSIYLPANMSESYSSWMWAVADGMGGYAHGKLASVIALEQLSEAYAKSYLTPSPAFRKGVEAANLKIFQAAQEMGVGHMGTTLTAVGLLGRKLHLLHVGDSRAYLVRQGKVTCLTNDHTVVGDMVRMRLISPNQVRNHAKRSVLTRAVGLSLFIQPEITQISLQDEDRVIICSDGVWSVIQDHEFGRISAATQDMDSVSQNIIDLALERQTDDNASVIAVYFGRSISNADKIASNQNPLNVLKSLPARLFNFPKQ